MGQAFFNLPQGGDCARIWRICGIISVLLHGLVLGALGFAPPVDFVKSPDTSISIDLDMIGAPPLNSASAPLETPAAPEETQEAQAVPEKVVEPESAPLKAERPKPKPASKKVETRKPVLQKSVVTRKRASDQPGPEIATGTGKTPVKSEGSGVISPSLLGGSTTPRPQYPELARKRGQEGTVNVRCQVDSSGQVTSVSVAKSSGFKLLDDAALKVVGKWKFKPAYKDGVSVPGTVVVPVQFKLQ